MSSGNTLARDKMRIEIGPCILIVSLMVLSSALIGDVKSEEEGPTRSVLKVGPGWTYRTINAAVADSGPGDTIYIYPGTFEEHVVVDHQLTFLGYIGHEIIGHENRPLFTLNADRCVIDGLNMRSDGRNRTDGIDVKSYWNRISNCTIQYFKNGIRLNDTVSCQVDNNQIANCTDSGILLDSANNCEIFNNRLRGNQEVGLNLSASSDNHFYMNNITGGFSSGDINADPTCHWKMDESSWPGTTGDVKDSSGNGNDGTSNGDSKIMNDPIRGKVGYFDGNGDHIRVPHSNSISSNTKGLSLMAWVKPTDINGTNRIVTKKWEWYFQIGGGGKLMFEISGQLPQSYMASDEILPQDTWTHVAATWDGTTRKLFINGEMVKSGSRSDTMSQFGYDVIIAESEGESRYFDGYLDDVMVFDRGIPDEYIQDYLINQKYGIYADIGSDSNIFERNDISNIEEASIALGTLTSSNILFHNNIYQVFGTSCSDHGSDNIWYHEGEGNYWGKNGTDSEPDGIWDQRVGIPGNIPSYDEYPLMMPWGILQLYTNDTYTVLEDSGINDRVTIRGVDTVDRIDVAGVSDWLYCDLDGRLRGIPENEHVGGSIFSIVVLAERSSVTGELRVEVVNTNDAPDITNTPPSLVTEGQDYNFTMEAEDIDPTSDTLVWSLRANRTFIRIGPDNGTIFGIADDPDLGRSWMNITVMDNHGATDHLNITFTVANVNDRPVILNEPPHYAVEDEYFEFQMEFYDPDPGDQHQWWLEDNGGFLSIGLNNGTITGTPENENVGTHEINITLRDREGDLDRVTFSMEVQNTNDDPVINNNWPREIIEDLHYEFQLIAYDPDPVDTEFTWKMRTDSSFARIDLEDELIICDPGDFDVGRHWVNVTVEDRMGGMDWFNHTFDVININDAPRALEKDSSINVMEDTRSKGIDPKEHFTDVDGDALNFDITWGNHILVVEEATGIFYIEPEANWSGSSMVKIKANDGEEWATKNITVIVGPVDDAPVISSIYTDKPEYEEGDLVTITATADDPDISYGDSLTYDWSLKGKGLRFQGEMISIELPPGTNELQLTVKDTQGNQATRTVFIKVNEEETSNIGLLLLGIGVVVFILILVILLVFFLIARKRRPKDAEVKEEPQPYSGLPESFRPPTGLPPGYPGMPQQNHYGEPQALQPAEPDGYGQGEQLPPGESAQDVSLPPASVAASEQFQEAQPPGNYDVVQPPSGPQTSSGDYPATGSEYPPQEGDHGYYRTPEPPPPTEQDVPPAQTSEASPIGTPADDLMVEENVNEEVKTQTPRMATPPEQDSDRVS